MSRPSQVWRSRLPRFLKEGVAGAAEALANADGTYSTPLTVKRLMEHRYYDGKQLSERAVQNQLRMCEACGLLVGPDAAVAAAGLGRGHKRAYLYNAAALATIDPTADYFRPPHRRKGATERCNRKGATAREIDVKTETRKGATKGATERCNSVVTPSLVQDLLRTKAPALHAGSHNDTTTTTPEPTPDCDTVAEAKVAAAAPDAAEGPYDFPTYWPAGDADVCPDGGDRPDDAGTPAAGRGGDHRAPPGLGLHLQQTADRPGGGGGDGSRAAVGPTQATLGPMDVSGPTSNFTVTMAQLRAQFATPPSQARRRRFG